MTEQMQMTPHCTRRTHQKVSICDCSRSLSSLSPTHNHQWIPKVSSFSLKRTNTSRGFLCLFLPVAILLFQIIVIVDGCQISEYYCDNRKCVSLDKFCNGVNDCGDGSDEPRYCSPCNRTYYGEVGGTYTIAVHRPSTREAQVPFVCQLTFAAGGSKFGDLVQIIFNSVTLGPPSSSDQSRFSPEKHPVCKEGYVTLNEPDRPATAGHWCGHDWGQAVFFSETSRVTLTLSLLNVPSNPGTFAFDFRLTYKVLRKVDAIVRYGPPSRPYFRGQLVPGTFCSLTFNSCDKSRCALQSPNFPGLYPRNVTCYYAIRALRSPEGHRPVIQLEQPKDHMIFVRNKAVSKKNAFVPGGYSESGGLSGSILGSSGQFDPSSGGKGRTDELTIGDDCDATSDHVIIYDGYTIRDPVLLKFCGGGRFPTITSSGNSLLMEFYSAPTDYLLQNNINTAIQGFHVDAEIKYLPVGSHTYVENHNCLFTISSFQQKRGFLTSPQHSLPSGTTCTYLLEGSPGEIVWISLLKFYVGKEYGKSGDESSSMGGSSPWHIPGLTGSSSTSGSSGSTSSSSSGSSLPNYVAPGQNSGLGGSASLFGECNTTYLQIWQGIYSEKYNNATLLAHLCEDTAIHKTCEFMLNPTLKTQFRACHPEESFISKGPNMILRLRIDTTTILRPVEFKLYYEFVDTKQDGEPFYHPVLSNPRLTTPNLPKMTSFTKIPLSGGPPSKKVNFADDRTSRGSKFDTGSCSRIFKSQNRAIQAGTFTSPRNVFYFGRGGIKNLTCVYRFQAGRHERVKVTFNNISLAGGLCKSDLDQNSGRWMCRDMSVNSTSPVTQGQVQLWEVPWNDSRIMKNCVCEVPRSDSVSFVSVAPIMDIVLTVSNMQSFHDQHHFWFEGRYEFIKHPDCSRVQKLKGPSGSFVLNVPEKLPHQSCVHTPWEIDPQLPHHYIYLTVPGRTMKKFSWKPNSSYFYSSSSSSFHSSNPKSSSSGSSSASSTSKSSSTTTTTSGKKKQQEVLQTHCETSNRILVYSGGFEGQLLQIICPEDSSTASSSPKNTVEIFSHGWEFPDAYPNFIENPNLSKTNLPVTNQLIVELVSRGPGSTGRYDVKWIQISRKDEPLEWNYNSLSSGTGAGGMSSGSRIFGMDGVKLISSGDSSSSSPPGGVPTSGGSATSSSIAASPPSSILNDIDYDVCFKFKCPELDACVSPSLFCDGVEHCPSGFDEADCEYFSIPRTYLIVAAGSLVTLVVLSCCFGCLVCKKRREERREKLLMSSRTPTEEMFFGGSSSNMAHREIVC